MQSEFKEHIFKSFLFSESPQKRKRQKTPIAFYALGIGKKEQKHICSATKTMKQWKKFKEQNFFQTIKPNIRRKKEKST